MLGLTPTRRRGTALMKLIILGFVAAITLPGCQKASEGLSPAPRAALVQTSDPEPMETEAGAARRESHPAQEAARDELGDQAADALVVEPRKPPMPPEPGALALVASMTASMPSRAADEQGITRIGLHYLRNLSRADAEEFNTLTQRLADLLSAAGRHLSTTFTTSFDEEVHYELLGTAYLITADGFDQWELFLRLSPADESWTIWEHDAPLRLIRHPRPGQAQITQWPLAR